VKRDNFEKENYFHTKNQENIKQELRKIKLERASEEMGILEIGSLGSL
jgi:hypothetical protein